MKNEIMVFDGLDVEVFELDGKVLFNAKDVANCLDIKNVRENLRTMGEKQVVRLTNSDVSLTDGRKLNNAGENFLTESGVYKLIFKSRKESAERFQDWVTDDVLPQIRQTGGYIQIDEDTSDDEIMARALIVAQKTIEKKNDIIKQLQPKAENYEQLIDSKGDLDFKQLTKSIDGLKIGRNIFMGILRDKKILMGDNTPYQQYITQDYFRVIQVTNGFHSSPKTLTTKKGLDWLIKKCKEWELI
jgi:anti-repressor protein